MKLYRLALKMCKIGLIGFGGGNALIPVMEKELVDGKILTKDEFDDDVMMASVTPGALPVEIACSVGSRLYGIKGMFAGAFSMAFPGAVLSLFLLSFLSYFESVSRYIHFFFVIISAFICSFLVEYILKTIGTSKNKYYVLFVIIFIAFLPFKSIQIFAFAFGVIFFLFFLKTIKIRLSGEKINYRIKSINVGLPGVKETAVCILIIFFSVIVSSLVCREEGLLFSSKGLLSSLMSFGGGDAYLAVAEGLFVKGSSNNGTLDPDVFYGEIVPIVNVLPGSILCKTLTGIGYTYGGIFLSAIGFIISVTASCLAVMTAKIIYSAFGSLELFDTIRYWIRPIVSGLLIKVGMALSHKSIIIVNSHIDCYGILIFLTLLFITLIFRRKVYINSFKFKI